MQEQGLPDGLMIQCTGFLPVGKRLYTPIDRSSNQSVVNRKNEGRHPKKNHGNCEIFIRSPIYGLLFFLHYFSLEIA